GSRLRERVSWLIPLSVGTRSEGRSRAAGRRPGLLVDGDVAMDHAGDVVLGGRAARGASTQVPGAGRVTEHAVERGGQRGRPAGLDQEAGLSVVESDGDLADVAGHDGEIGRASCRERVWVTVGGVDVK